MSTLSTTAAPRRNKARLRAAVGGAVAVALVLAMGLDTTWVKIGGAADVAPGAFSPLAYGQKTFPTVQKAILGRAVPAPVLAAALAKDPAAAAKQYGVESGVGVEYPVSFTGTLGDGDFGNYDVTIPDMPPGVKVALQTGPAIMGTDLRDATGTIQFGQFTNQIDYQNAGSALNKEMKKQVLSKLDTSDLKGKTVSVVGVFQLTDPAKWLVTPVSLEVK
jgi:predicted lipoprotein